MKVIMLCQFFYPEKVSSAVLPYELATALVCKGVKVNALCGQVREKDIGRLPKKDLVNDIEITRCTYKQFDKDNFFGRILNYIAFVSSTFMHLNLFVKKDICIVYSNPPLLAIIPAILKKFFKFKLIYVVYDIYPDVAVKFSILKEGSFIAKVFNRINNLIYKNCDKLIVLSSEMERYLNQEKQIDSSRMEIIPNWYELDCDYTKYVSKDECITILYGGNMGVCQEMDTMINLANSLKDDAMVKFIFVGNGVKSEYIKNTIKTNNLENCQFYDFLSRPKYEKIMKQADLFVVSLEKKAVGLGSPSKVYCYYAMGRAVLAIMDKRTDVATEIINYNCGFQLDPGCDVNLAKKLIKGIDKKKLETFGENARKLYLEKYRMEISTNKYFNLIKELLL